MIDTTMNIPILRMSPPARTTGLMYRPPVNMEEYESYQDVYGMEIPKIE